jgi:hypothetical protein
VEGAGGGEREVGRWTVTRKSCAAARAVITIPHTRPGGVAMRFQLALALFAIATLSASSAEAQLQDDPCHRPELRSPGALTWLNNKIGQPGGPAQRVVSIENLSGINQEGPHFLNCHATLVFANGGRDAGTLYMDATGRTPQEAEGPLRVSWISDASKPAPSLAANCDSSSLDQDALAACWRSTSLKNSISAFTAAHQRDCAPPDAACRTEIVDRVTYCIQYGETAWEAYVVTRDIANLPIDEQNSHLITAIRKAANLDPRITPHMIGAEAFSHGLYGTNHDEVVNFAGNMCLAGKEF